MTRFHFRFVPPPHTPFHDDLSLNLDRVDDQAAFFARAGVDGVFVAGSTGEGQSLSTDEREQLAERWMDAGARHGLETILQVGQNAQGEAVRLAVHAQRIGADAVAASAPCYFKPEGVEDLIAFLEPVAAAAGDLPFYFYDIPPFTGSQLPMADFLRCGKERIPNLVGLKYSNTDLMQMQACVQLNDGEFEVLYGSDQTLLAGIVLGARGAVGTTYNFAMPLYRRLLDAFQAGDWNTARQWQAKSVDLVQTALKYGGIAAFKAIMRMAGVDCGPVRPPLTNLAPAAAEALRDELDAKGLLALCRAEAPVPSA